MLIQRLINYLIATIIGLAIPIFFAYLGMWELEIDTNLNNLVDMVKSQNVYLFSAFCFPIIFMITIELISKNQQKNELIQKDFDYLKVILNATPDAIVFLDQDKKVTFQNNQFKSLFHNFESVYNDSDLASYVDNMDFIQKEVLIHSKVNDGHPFLMNFKATTYQDKKNYFLSFKDLKNLKDKEKIIEDQEYQMIERNKLASMGEMAAGIAHEINNPLTVIHSNNSLIRRMVEKDIIDPVKFEKITLKTREQVERITKIIRSLRNLSRGLANEDLEHFSIDQVLDESISLAKIRDTGRNVEFHFESHNVYVFGNRGQIVQVILNLLNNSIDSIDKAENPWVKLELKQEQGFVELYVIDSGNGIPAEIIDKIFVPMYTTKGVGKGTGLGLSLSRSFMEQNGGSIEYDSSKSNTCFKVRMKSGHKTDDKENVA